MDVRFPIVFLLAFAFSGAVMAQSIGEVGPEFSPVRFRNHALPVLVHVDKAGHVTDMQPAVHLRPAMRRMLRKTLDQMIVAPAMHDGHPMSSQFVIQLALKARKRADGKYDVHFEYVSSMPVPSGPLHWVRNGEGQLALAFPPGNDYMYRPQNGSMRDSLPVYHPPVNRGGTPPGIRSPTTNSHSASVAFVSGRHPG